MGNNWIQEHLYLAIHVFPTEKFKFSPRAFKGLEDISRTVPFPIQAQAQAHRERSALSATAAAPEAAAAGWALEHTKCEAFPQCMAAAAAEIAARFADSNPAATVGGEGGGCCCVHAVCRLCRLKGLPNLLQPRFRCHALHFTDELGEVADEVRVQLQIAVTASFDP